MDKEKRIGVRLTEVELTKLDQLQAATGEKISEVMRRALDLLYHAVFGEVIQAAVDPPETDDDRTK